MRSRSWSNLAALMLTFTALAVDQVLYIWSGQRASVCFEGKNPNGDLWGNLVFAAPLVVLIFAQIIQLRLPITRARNAAGFTISAILLAYIAFSIMMWPEDGWLNATKEEISACYRDMEIGFSHNAFHVSLWLPCALFLLLTVTISTYYNRLTKRRRSSTDSPR